MPRTVTLNKLNIQFNRPQDFIFEAIERGMSYGYMRLLKKNCGFEEDLRKVIGDDKLDAVFEVLDKYADDLVKQQRTAVENEMYEILNFNGEGDDC